MRMCLHAHMCMCMHVCVCMHARVRMHVCVCVHERDTGRDKQAEIGILLLSQGQEYRRRHS